MQIASYQFTCRFNSQAVLPVFKGSTLRGGLGHALKRIACALRQQECQDCLLHQTCAYSFLFERKKDHSRVSATSKIRYVAPPHPYILCPPEENKRVYEVGELFSFGVTLLGTTIQFLPHLVFAVQEMGKTGLGKNTHGGSGQFHLETVNLNNNTIYTGQSLDTTIAPDELTLLDKPQEKINRITLTCHTPLRLKKNNELQDKLPFQLLIRAALRRISALESTYDHGEPDLDYKGLVQRASRVTRTQPSLRWREIERYSNRQKRAMLMGGITGSVTYQDDDLSEFVPLLRYCERVHLGKETSFGLGRITIKTGEEL
jgi:hypothetical protein